MLGERGLDSGLPRLRKDCLLVFDICADLREPIREQTMGQTRSCREVPSRRPQLVDPTHLPLQGSFLDTQRASMGDHPLHHKVGKLVT